MGTAFLYGNASNHNHDDRYLTENEVNTLLEDKVGFNDGKTISGTEIEVTSKGEIESVLQISGNSVQATRSGKNLLKKGSDYATKESDGITFTVNNDESVTINGTNGGNYNSALYLWNSSGTPLVLPAGTYNSSTGHTKVTLEGYDGTNYYILASSSKNTFTLDTDVSFQQIYLQIAKGTTETFSDVTVYPIVTKSIDSVTPYEPYGIVPSPEFESPIMSVKSKSDNLFDISKKKDNTTYTWAGGADYASTGQVLSDYIPTAGIKTLSSNYYFNIAFYKADKTYIGNGEELSTGATNLTKNVTIPDNENIAYFRVVYKKNSQNGNIDMTTVTDIMLNKGTVALPYQPYGYVDVEVKVEGRNIAEIEAGGNVYVTDGTCTQGTADTKTDMQWKVEGRLEAKFVKSFARYVDNSLGVKVRSFVKDDSFDRLYIGLNGSTRDTLIYIPVDNLINGETYTVQWNVLNATQGSVSWNNVQLEKGATATPFVNPPKTISLPLGDIELRSTPDGTRDTFAKVDGVWNVVSNVNSVKYDGVDEAWSYGTQTEDTTRFRVYISNSTFADSKVVNVRCNKLIGIDYENFWSNMGRKFIIALSNGTTGGKNRLFATTKYSEVPINNETEWKTWLKSNPITVDYLLATPTYTPITDQGLISALDELEQLILHKGYNRITVTGVNGAKAYLELDIPATASVTNVIETETAQDLVVPSVVGEGDTKLKIPAKEENQMTINPSTGLVKAKELEVEGKITADLLEGTATKAKGLTYEEVPENADLNDYTTSGVYCQTRTDLNKSIANNPLKSVSTGFVMEVLNATETGTMQILYGTSVNRMFKRRYFPGTGWNSWGEVSFTDHTHSNYSYLSQYKVTGSTGDTQYYKLFTITPYSAGYKDFYYVFNVAGRSRTFTEVHLTFSTGNDNYFSNITFEYVGNSTIAGNLKAYYYKDETNATSRIEVWAKVTEWNVLSFYPKTVYNRNAVTLTWNMTAGTAFPTDFTTDVAIAKKSWTGNAATSTSATSASFASQVTVARSQSTGYYPILLTNVGDGTTTKSDSIYAPYNNTVTMNPKDGIVKATKFEGSIAKTFTATIPTSGWSSSAPYYVDVTVTGILATDTPNVTPTYSGTLSTDKTRKENWNKIDRIVTSADKIRVYAFEEKPTATVPIQLVVVR